LQLAACLGSAVAASIVIAATAGATPKKGGGDSDGDFSALTSGRPVVNDCSASFHVEVDAASFQQGYKDLAAKVPGFTWDQAKHDIIESCFFALNRLGPLCHAQGRNYHGDPDENPANDKIKRGIKTLRCSLGSAQAPQSSFANGTWSVAFSWWTTKGDFIGAELAVASALQLDAPPHETATDEYPARSICHAARDCKSGFTCAASAAHGPRCLSKADLAPPPADTSPDEAPATTSHPTTSTKPKARKKTEGELCHYSDECEQRPGVRCSRPRNAKSTVKTTCMYSGY
jgi:hypothetical protein